MENAMISMLDLCPEVGDRVITALTADKYDVRPTRREVEVIEGISLQPPDMVLLVLPRADSASWQVLGRLRAASDVPLMVIIAEATSSTACRPSAWAPTNAWLGSRPRVC